MTPRMTRFVLAVSAPLLALVAAFAITSLVLAAAGDPVVDVWKQILSWPERPQHGQHHQQRHACSTSPVSPPRSASG